eukprot:gene6436-8215_t
MRLALWDGTGLDFMTAVATETDLLAETPNGTYYYNASHNNSVTFRQTNYVDVKMKDSVQSGGYTTMLIFYIIFATIILLNGLIGIFADAFDGDEPVDDDAQENRFLDKLLADVKSIKEHLT